MKKILKGNIYDESLINSIKQESLIDLKNIKLRDGMEYKITLSSNNYNKKFLLDESCLTENFKKLIDIAEKNDSK